MFWCVGIFGLSISLPWHAVLCFDLFYARLVSLRIPHVRSHINAAGSLRDSSIVRGGGNTASIAPDFTAALHFTYCCFLRFACTFLFYHVFLSLHKKWRTDLSRLQRHILDSKYGRVELFRLDWWSGWNEWREMKLLPVMASCWSRLIERWDEMNRANLKRVLIDCSVYQ